MQQVAKLLDKAITLHRKHMVNPKTATPESQEELMDLIEDAREELHGGEEMMKKRMSKGHRKMGYGM